MCLLLWKFDDDKADSVPKELFSSHIFSSSRAQFHHICIPIPLPSSVLSPSPRACSIHIIKGLCARHCLGQWELSSEQQTKSLSLLGVEGRDNK